MASVAALLLLLKMIPTTSLLALAAPRESRKVARAVLEERFAKLLAQNQASLTRLASSYTRGRSDRDDLLQEIAMGLWLALPGFREECSDRTFLFRIAHNRCITHISRRRNTEPLDEHEHQLADSTPPVESRIDADQRSQDLRLAIRKLPMHYHQVVVLALEGMDYREISAVLGISESNVGVRLNRARALLKTALGDST